MLGLLIRWFLGAFALYVTTRVVPGVVIEDATSLFVAVLVMGLLNAILRPIVNLFTGCLQILTLGLLTLVINAGFFMLVGNVVPGFEVAGFWSAFWGSIVMSILSLILSMFVRTDEKKNEHVRD
jgi:putative membrane protein